MFVNTQKNSEVVQVAEERTRETSVQMQIIFFKYANQGTDFGFCPSQTQQYLPSLQTFFSQNASFVPSIVRDYRDTHFPRLKFGLMHLLPEDINHFDSLSPSGAYIMRICVGVCEVEWSSRTQLVRFAKEKTHCRLHQALTHLFQKYNIYTR